MAGDDADVQEHAADEVHVADDDAEGAAVDAPAIFLRCFGSLRAFFSPASTSPNTVLVWILARSLRSSRAFFPRQAVWTLIAASSSSMRWTMRVGGGASSESESGASTAREDAAASMARLRLRKLRCRNRAAFSRRSSGVSLERRAAAEEEEGLNEPGARERARLPEGRVSAREGEGVLTKGGGGRRGG